MTKVCVIILSWNRKKDTLETVRSLAKSDTSGYELEIMVVDSGSTDGSQAAIKKLFSVLIGVSTKIIELAENIGFAGGNNVGIKDALARGFDYVALLNDDTIVDKSLVKNILREHKKYKKAGAISPKIYFAKGFEYHDRYKKGDLGKIIWYAGGDIDWDNVYGSNHGVDEVDTGQYDKVSDTDFATGCFVMWKANALKSVGPYDDRYFAYMEDADHAQRLKKAGYRVLYAPKGWLWHKVSQSSGIGSTLNDYFLSRNRLVFGMRYASFRTKFALLRESIKHLLAGRTWQKKGVRDFYLGRLGKGSWE